MNQIFKAGKFLPTDGSHTEPFSAIIIGEIEEDDRPRCWLVISNDPHWDAPAAVGSPIFLSKDYWKKVEDGEE